MDDKLTGRLTRHDKELYKMHRHNLKYAQPKVDNSAPLLAVDAYYKIGEMESNAQRLTNIEEENFKLIKRINLIYRTQGKTNCHQSLSIRNRKSDWVFIVNRNNKIFEENKKLHTKLANAGPGIDIIGIRKTEEEHDMKMLEKSRYPEYLKMKMDRRANYDPLVVNLTAAGLTRNIEIKKSKCYFEIKDLSRNERLGWLMIQLYDGIVPKTAANFVKLCQQRDDKRPNYSGSSFFRIVPGLFCLGGDVEYSLGIGGTSATKGQRYFDDENYELSHNAPGVLSMYNFERNENGSQFLITFKPLKTLDGRFVVFGRVLHGLHLLKLIEQEGYPSGKPRHKIIINSCGVIC